MNSPHHHQAATLVALASGFVMASMDSTVVNVAVVSIGRELGGSLNELTWIVDAYVLTFASLLLFGGALATALGSRRLYIAGMLVFLTASLIASVAPTIFILIAARALQGTGAAMFMPSSLALLVMRFTEPSQRARMLGLWSALVAGAAALGPTLGGILVSTLGWRSIFLVNIPVVIVGITLTSSVIPADRAGRIRLSPLGHLLVLVMLASASFCLIQGHSSGFGAPLILLGAAIFVLSCLAFIAQQLRTPNPVLPWALFRNPGFSLPNLIGFFYSGALYGCLYLMGLFFQNERNANPLVAGLQLLPMTICFPLGNILYARIHRHLHNPLIMLLCLLIAGLASLLLVNVTAMTPYWQLAVALGIANSGAGLVTASMTSATVEAARDHYANYAGAALNTNRQLGVLFGIATVGLIIQRSNGLQHGMRIASATVVAAYLLASICALVLLLLTKKASGRE